jgi:TP53 regulating kinase-like protein
MATLTPTLIGRGAEAEIYSGDFLGLKVVVKKRVSKPFRDPIYNRVFIESRTRTEAKILSELYLAGLPVPPVFLVDEEAGVIVMGYVEGSRLSDVLGELAESSIKKIGWSIGKYAALMHNKGVYHGDYTLANIILTSSEDLVIIDFGLAGYSNDIEEYAIDLHLMNRSAEAMYPELAGVFTRSVFEGYLEYSEVGGDSVIKKVREIRARGRYIEREVRKAVLREKYVD